MSAPTIEQQLVTIPVLCQLLVEFIEDTGGAPNVYRQELKRHANGMIKSADKFLAAVYGHAKTVNHSKVLADEQNNIALFLKKVIAESVVLED